MTAESIRPLTLAVCQFAPGKGNTGANLERLGALCAQAAQFSVRPQIIHFPESALSGYFVEGAVREVAYTAGSLANDIDESYRIACAAAGVMSLPVDVVVGFYERWRDTLYNSSAYITIGLNDGPPVLRHVHRKNYLPTYGMFDEERFVERGSETRAFETPWGRAAMLVCEDAWHSLSGTIAALDGAQIVFVCSAAPARGVAARSDGISGPYTVARWDRLIRDIAEEHGVFVSLANLVGSEGGKRFFGASTIVGPHGDVRARAPVWEESLVVATLDIDDIVRARSDAPLLSDLRVSLPHMLDNITRVINGTTHTLQYDGPEPAAADILRNTRGYETGEYPVVLEEPLPSTAVKTPIPGSIPVLQLSIRDHGGPPSLDIDPVLTEQWLVGFLKEEFARRKFSRAVVGLSGGVDSAVTIALATRALGADNVVAVRMPYKTSSSESLDHAQLVVNQLGIECRTIDISAAVDGYLSLEPEADAARKGNVMARMRMIALFDLSARYKALPIGTGNKTERLLGYFTWHADDSPPINPIGDLYKTQVWQLAKQLDVPHQIVSKPATADLIVGQTDEADLGIRYERADQILNGLLHGFTFAAMRSRGFTAQELDTVNRRLSSTHWKRRHPSTALVSQSAIGESYLRPVDY